MPFVFVFWILIKIFKASLNSGRIFVVGRMAVTSFSASSTVFAFSNSSKTAAAIVPPRPRPVLQWK